MATSRRAKIGLIYSYNENWIGGTYYILNIVKSLNYLPEKEKPVVIIFTKTIDEFLQLQEVTSYPYLQHELLVNTNKWQKKANKLTERLFGKKFFGKIFGSDEIDFVFPNPPQVPILQNLKRVSWIPDFQHIHLPQFFSEAEIKRRNEHFSGIAKNAEVLVLSSFNSYTDFKNLFPSSDISEVILPFAVVNPDLKWPIKKVKSKYSVEGDYFFCANQFWKHKNHKLIFEALVLAKKEAEDIKIIFSGKESDYRSPEYFNELQTFIKQNKLESNVKFLGFLDREDQLHLLKGAKANIQPSLFEGWSTVVEDCKSLNQYLIVSDIEVHKEQLQNYKNKSFFDPLN
ncbi:glycosyltransferase [Marivirga sp.]|uniref:glycosyltransferase n=1 Tax=Marivirga sp. TaxID=2018662 RepID=UPI0025E37990|nr:glycosyltransferase [Marivirga sp.]